MSTTHRAADSMTTEFFYVITLLVDGSLTQYRGVYRPRPGDTQESTFAAIERATKSQNSLPATCPITYYHLAPNALP